MVYWILEIIHMKIHMGNPSMPIIPDIIYVSSFEISSPLKYPQKKRMGEAESPAMPKPHGAWSPEPTPHLEVQIAGKNGAFQLDFTMKHGSFSKDWT